MNDLISRQAAIDHLKKRLIETAINNTGVKALCDSIFADIAENRIEPWVNELPSAQPEIKPIDYRDCANAMMKMWMDNIVTDGEYNRIMDRLNAYCPWCVVEMNVEGNEE